MIALLVVELVAACIVAGLFFELGRRFGKWDGARSWRKLAEIGDPVTLAHQVAALVRQHGGGEKLGPWLVSRPSSPSETPIILYAEDIAKGLTRFADDLHEAEEWNELAADIRAIPEVDR